MRKDKVLTKKLEIFSIILILLSNTLIFQTNDKIQINGNNLIRKIKNMITRKDNEQPFAISKKGMRYHHIGIPTNEIRPNEKYLKDLKFYVSGFDTSEYGIEWMRFEKDSPVPDIIKRIPHIAFEVDNLEKVIEGKELIGEVSSPSDGVKVAMIIDKGVPVEFLQFNKKR